MLFFFCVSDYEQTIVEFDEKGTILKNEASQKEFYVKL